MKAGEGSPLCTEYVTTGTMIGIKKITNLGNLTKHNWEEKNLTTESGILVRNRCWSKVRIRHRGESPASSQLAGKFSYDSHGTRR